MVPHLALQDTILLFCIKNLSGRLTNYILSSEKYFHLRFYMPAERWVLICFEEFFYLPEGQTDRKWEVPFTSSLVKYQQWTLAVAKPEARNSIYILHMGQKQETNCLSHVQHLLDPTFTGNLNKLQSAAVTGDKSQAVQFQMRAYQQSS